MKLKQISIFLVITLISFLSNSHSYATENSMTLNEVRSSLKTAGSYRFVYRMFFKLYDARLLTNASQAQDLALLLNGANSLLLEFDYLRKIDKSIILESSEKILSKNMSPAELDLIQGRVDLINEAYRTVNKGDRSALSYIPGKGTTLWINEKPIVTIEGEDFARLYFRIWLGENPISRQMREALVQGMLQQG